MLKQLLSVLSETLSPASPTSNRPVAADPGAYIELLDPIGEGAGIDLTHEDEYAALQDQIAKRGDIDDSVVLGNATLLLRDRGKDVRAAVFMAYSTLRVDGLVAMLPVLGLIHALVERFGEGLHPRKAMARRAALEWLCNERFVDPLTLQAQAASESVLLDLQRRLQGLAAAVQAWPVESRPDLSGLTQRVDHWLAKKSDGELRQAVSHGAVPEPSLPAMLGAAAEGDAGVNPKSSQDAWQLVRKASAVLRADPAWADAGRCLLRTARWSAITAMPPHQGGLTRLAAPRKESRNYLEGLRSSGQWLALPDECARVFNEGSNHFWLDLAFWADQAHAQSGAAGELARERLVLDVRALLARAPQLATLRFDDGLPFAEAATQSWINAMMNRAAPTAPPASSSASSEDFAALQVSARTALRTHGIGAALALVQLRLLATPAHSERFEMQRLMLRLAHEDGRTELALGLARDLTLQAERFGLALWAPDLAFDTWAALLGLLRAGGPALQAEARDVHARLCGIDPARAAQLQ